MTARSRYAGRMETLPERYERLVDEGKLTRDAAQEAALAPVRTRGGHLDPDPFISTTGPASAARTLTVLD